MFNLRCKKLGGIPRTVWVPDLVGSEEGRRIPQRAGLAFVKERLRISERKKRELTDFLKWTEIGLERRLGSGIWKHYKEFIQKKTERAFQSTKDKQPRKLDLLRMRSKVVEVDRRVGPNDEKERWVINLSEKELTSTERNVWEKGMKFSPTPWWVPTVDVIASVKDALKTCNHGMGAEMA